MRGFALRDAMAASQPNHGTYLGRSLEDVEREGRGENIDRVIVITDEQSQDRVGEPGSLVTGAERGYMINVASAQYGVGYGDWVRLNSFSEAVVEYIRASER